MLTDAAESGAREWMRGVAEAEFVQVVTPVDFSAASWQAATLGARLGAAFGAQPRVIHVETIPWLDEEAGQLQIDVVPGRQRVAVEVIAAPSVADGIVRTLTEADQSLLVTATHAHAPVTEAVLGSTLEEVLERWSGAIVAVGRRCRTEAALRRIVVCVDPALPPPRRLIAETTAWSRRLDLPVTVLGVTGDSVLRDRARGDVRLAEAAAELSTPRRPASVAMLRSGSVPGNIVAFADAQPGTLIAMAPHVRPLSVRMVMGSVAMAVCRLSASPVLLSRVDR